MSGEQDGFKYKEKVLVYNRVGMKSKHSEIVYLGRIATVYYFM